MRQVVSAGAIECDDEGGDAMSDSSPGPMSWPQ